MKRLAAVLALMSMVGCSTMGGGIFGASEKFTVTICAEGVIIIPCTATGTVSVPQGGEGLLTLAVALAGPFLLRQAKLENCFFETYPALMGPSIQVTATAACMLRGVPAVERVTMTFAPVPVPAS